MAYRITQSEKPPEFSSGFLPVLYASSGGLYFGDNLMSKQIPLTQGKFAIVDDEDYDWLMQWKWCAAKQNNGDFYAIRRTSRKPIKRKTIYMHRQILNVNPKMLTDHCNHCGLDNRKLNIRSCTNSQNRQNQIPVVGTSKFKGVYWNKNAKKWCTNIYRNYKRYHLGYFENEIDAAKVYDKKAKELFGVFAYLNFGR